MDVKSEKKRNFLKSTLFVILIIAGVFFFIQSN